MKEVQLEVSKKCLKQLREAKTMKPLEKAKKGFEQQTCRPQQTGRDTRTGRRKVTVIHKTSRRTGTGTGTATGQRGTAQHRTAHDSTGEHSRQGDAETTLTFKAGYNSKFWLCSEQHWLQSNMARTNSNNRIDTHTGRTDGPGSNNK